MDKGYYTHQRLYKPIFTIVAIHNKNGQGLLQELSNVIINLLILSQSTIKMDKGYYQIICENTTGDHTLSQSTIKMDKGYY